MTGLYCGADGDDPVMALKHLHGWSSSMLRNFETELSTDEREHPFTEGSAQAWGAVRDAVAETLDQLEPAWRKPRVIEEPF